MTDQRVHVLAYEACAHRRYLGGGSTSTDVVHVLATCHESGTQATFLEWMSMSLENV